MPPQMPILSSSDNKRKEFGIQGRPGKRQGAMQVSSCVVSVDGAHLQAGVTKKNKETVELDR